MTRKVMTINGCIEKITDCKKIEGDYYKIGDRKIENSGDCYIINGRHFKSNTGYIIFDNYKKQYEIANSLYTKGVIRIDENNNFVIGIFLKNNLQCFVKEKGSSTILKAMNYTIFDNSNFVVNKKTEVFTHKNDLRLEDYLNYEKVNSDLKRSLNYNITNEAIQSSKKSMEEYSKYLPKYNFAKGVSKYLNDLTFGLEFETTEGTIPIKYCAASGLVPLRDGSIRGLEYVTLPLQGEDGINKIMNISKLLNTYTNYNHSCSLHLHLGNIPRTESFIVALFRTLAMVENDFFDMFPLYKKINAGFKNKNYTAPLPCKNLLNKMDSKIDSSNVSKNFSYLFEYLSNGESYSNYGNSLDKVHSHPYDPDNNRKWNVRSRYHWVNLIPLIFGNKQTVEFRIHTPVKDPDKVMLFLLMCSKLVNFVKSNEKDILSNKFNNLDLKFILNYKNTNLNFEGKLNSFISNYFSNRKQFTTQQYQKNNFNYSEQEFEFKSTRSFRSDTVYFLNEDNLDSKNPSTPKKAFADFMEGMDNEIAMPSYRNEGIVEGRRSSRQPVRTETTEATSTEPATSTSWYDMATQRINNNES